MTLVRNYTLQPKFTTEIQLRNPIAAVDNLRESSTSDVCLRFGVESVEIKNRQHGPLKISHLCNIPTELLRVHPSRIGLSLWV